MVAAGLSILLLDTTGAGWTGLVGCAFAAAGGIAAGGGCCASSAFIFSRMASRAFAIASESGLGMTTWGAGSGLTVGAGERTGSGVADRCGAGAGVGSATGSWRTEGAGVHLGAWVSTGAGAFFTGAGFGVFLTFGAGTGLGAGATWAGVVSGGELR